MSDAALSAGSWMRASAGSGDPASGVVDGDLGCAGIQPPGLGADQLQQELVAAGAVDHDLQGRVADATAG